MAGDLLMFRLAISCDSNWCALHLQPPWGCQQRMRQIQSVLWVVLSHQSACRLLLFKVPIEQQCYLNCIHCMFNIILEVISNLHRYAIIGCLRLSLMVSLFCMWNRSVGNQQGTNVKISNNIQGTTISRMGRKSNTKAILKIPHHLAEIPTR